MKTRILWILAGTRSKQTVWKGVPGKLGRQDAQPRLHSVFGTVHRESPLPSVGTKETAKGMDSNGPEQKALDKAGTRLWKRALGWTVRRILGLVRRVLKLLPLRQDTILFESLPELSGSSRMIYDELRRRGLDRHYRLRWAVAASFSPPGGIDGVPFFGDLGLKALMRREIVRAKAKAIVDSNRFVWKGKKSTYRLYVRHGGVLKNCDWYLAQMGEVDCCLSLSENLLEAERKQFRGKLPRFAYLGYPAHDQLFEPVDLYALGFWKKLTGRPGRFSKIIGWMPTYRQHNDSLCLNRDTTVFPFGVPLLRTDEDFRHLNALLQRENILLAVQMHPAQAANFPRWNLSHIVKVDSALKEAMGLSTLHLMKGFDALVTDYSGAYYEFILLDRPVGITVDDYAAYAEKPGFAVDFFDWIKGEYLETPLDLERFVENVAQGLDSAREARRAAVLRIHPFTDNQSTKRVADLLCAEAGLAVGAGERRE